MWFTVTDEVKEVPMNFVKVGAFRTKKAAEKEGFQQHFKEEKSEYQYIVKYAPNKWLLYVRG